jgi:O-antigen ligase
MALLLNKNLRVGLISLFSSLKKKNKAALYLVLILMLFSTFLADAPKSALQESSLYVGVFFLLLSISSITKSNTLLIQHTFLLAFTASALLYLAQAFAIYLASFIENIPLQWPEPFSGFSNVRFFNQFQIWTITLLPLPILLYPNLDKRILNALKMIAIGWALLLFASSSRGAIGSIILAMLITLSIFKHRAKSFLKINVLILLVGVTGYFLLFQLLPFVLENKVTKGWSAIEHLSSTNDRIALWQTAINYIIDKPWLGIGPMHYAYYPGPTNAHPHNGLLQWACEMGIPSALLIVFLVMSGLIAWVKKFYRLSEENKLYISTDLWIALFCSLCSGLIYSMVSGVIVTPLSQIMMALIAGWMLGIYFQDQESKAVSQKQNLGFMLLAGLTLITLTYTVLPGLMPRLMAYSDLPLQDYPTIAPRFWQFGGIPH